MVKKFFRSLMLGIIIFAIAVLAGYLSYVITYRYQIQKVRDAALPKDNVAAAPVYQETIPLPESDTNTVEHYIARLEDNHITIYTFNRGKEAFLYTLDVRTGDLPTEDRTRLSQGIVLQDKQALASFEEDFTS